MKGFLMITMMMFVGFSYAQTSTAVIQTSAECGSCKKRIEGKLNYTNGVKFAELDMATKKVTVKYNEKKISLMEVKKVISETGYAADEVAAVPEAVEKLPTCCKPGGMANEK